MLVDKVGHVVDVLVDDDVEPLVRAVVGGDVGGGEGLGHFGSGFSSFEGRTGCVCVCVSLVGRVCRCR